MSEPKKIKALVLKDFTDAGTHRHDDAEGVETKYVKGDTPEIDEGHFLNFKAAKLVDFADAKAADTKGAKGSTPAT